MSTNQTLTLADGRAVGFSDYGPAHGTPVIWCHGGPGSRLVPATLVEAAHAEGLRLVGIDRPGYGLSTPKPGRTIGEWPLDALAVIEALGLGRFLVAGGSTGGAYALALAAQAPELVRGVVVFCAVTDLRWQDGKRLMTEALPLNGALWGARSREEALQVATKQLGEDGSRVSRLLEGVPFPPADLAVLGGSPAGGDPEAFAFGVQGLVDDRLADGLGWVTFDVWRIAAPVIVLHGAEDRLVPPDHARRTAAIVPGSILRLVPKLGHFSIGQEVAPALKELLA